MLNYLSGGFVSLQASFVPFAVRTKIGIGAQIALGPLPHHLACGSALGDSSLRSKFAPDLP